MWVRKTDQLFAMVPSIEWAKHADQLMKKNNKKTFIMNNWALIFNVTIIFVSSDFEKKYIINL